VIDLHDLSVTYGDRRAVDGVSFSVSAGEFIGLLGPNGAGKTSMIGALCGLIEPAAGRVRVAGLDPYRERAAAAAKIGFVPQALAFYDALTARQNLVFFGRTQGLWGSRLDHAIARVLEIVQLESRADERVRAFSGGMQRRLNVAIGLLHEPAVLVLDEPTVGVDAQSRSTLLESFQSLGAGGTTILYATHQMEEAQRLCGRVAIMDEGRIIANGAPDELIERHAAARLRVAFDRPPPASLARSLTDAGVARDVSGSGFDLELLVGRTEPALNALAEQTSALGLTIQSLELPKPSLDSVFLRLTGRRLRNSESSLP
jgi:ABC-2 type transport system ATP-binding protein